MGILLAAIAICLTLWVAVAIRRGWLSFGWFFCPSLVAACVILVGSVFGREFFSLDIGPLPITLDRILWVWMIGLFAALIVSGRLRPQPWNATDVFVAALLALLTISTFAHDFAYRDHLPLTRLLFFNVLPIGIYFVVRHAPISERQLSWILYGLMGFGVYLSATAVAEWRNWPQLVFPRYIMDSSFAEFLGRGRGPFLNPVVCGIFQIAGMIAAILQWPRCRMPGRILIGMLVGLFAVGIFATFTRSVWLSMIVGMALALWLPATIRRRGALIIAGTAAATLFVAFFADNINAFKRDKNVTEAEMSESVQLRPLLAEVAWQMFLDRPVLGHGFGQYSQAKRLYHQQVSNEPLKKVLPYMQHNVVLSYMTETGGVGTALLLAIFALMGATAFRLYSRAPLGSHRKEIGLLCLVVLAGYFLNGMFHDVSIMPMVGSLFYFLLGLTNQLESTLARVSQENATGLQLSAGDLPPQRMAS